MTSYIASSPFSEYLQDLYLEDEGADDALSAAIYAASFATFALRTRNHKYLNKGRNKYSLALSRTNNALKDPKGAVLDRTLASVLLLGLFESTVFMGKASPVEWTMHMTGALRILQLRGLQQFKSNVAHQLFVHAANNIRTSCIQREMNVHDELLVLNKSAILFLGPGDPSNKFSAILDKTASIRAQIRNSSRLLETNNIGILQEVLNLDREAIGLMNDSECNLPYTIRSVEDTPSWAYLHTAYRYSSFRIAKFWNTIRMVRLFLNEIIWNITSNALGQIRDGITDTTSHPEFDKFTMFLSLRETSVKNSTDIATGVLTCIPDFIEPHPSGRRFSPAARTLAWPLYLLYKCPLCPQEARVYARDWLEELAKDLNLPQVVETANFNLNSGSPDDW
ncbi:c6 zinc finger domain-containing [Trichoderma arundinaceum]|uniref:C6 zinc finger domain-containing n=1 Tax=Trichoderma arundinaceum TaxID=490622 RepID=A0A395NXC6_TRIAR|nr:c6 zinc finger domain-containing [Trichoderma arundinaceum]